MRMISLPGGTFVRLPTILRRNRSISTRVLNKARCCVSYKNDEGLQSVEVTAETLFEAVAQAVVEFKEDKTITTAPGPETELTVVVIRKPAEHIIRLKRVHEWARPSGVNRSPETHPPIVAIANPYSADRSCLRKETQE